MAKVNKALVILSVLVVGGLLCPRSSLASEIRGEVLLHSDSGDRPLSRQAVRLRIIRGENEVQWAEALTDGKGTYRFSNLDASPEFLYAARVEYQGVPYDGLPVRFEGSKNLVLPPFRVSPSTTSTEHLEASEKVVLSFGRKDLVTVQETITFWNRGDTTFGGRPIEIPLLAGGFDLNLLEGLSEENMEIDPERSALKLRGKILPGEDHGKTIRFSYSFPYRSRALSLGFPLSVARSGFDLIVISSHVSVQSGQLDRMPASPSARGRTLVFSGGPFAAGETVRLEVSGLWRAEDVGYVAVLAGLAAVLLLSVWLGLRRKGGSEVDAALNALAALENDVSEDALAERQRLRELLFHHLHDTHVGKAA
jgi:hypothetical protein